MFFIYKDGVPPDKTMLDCAVNTDKSASKATNRPPASFRHCQFDGSIFRRKFTIQKKIFNCEFSSEDRVVKLRVMKIYLWQVCDSDLPLLELFWGLQTPFAKSDCNRLSIIWTKKNVFNREHCWWHNYWAWQVRWVQGWVKQLHWDGMLDWKTTSTQWWDWAQKGPLLRACVRVCVCVCVCVCMCVCVCVCACARTRKLWVACGNLCEKVARNDTAVNKSKAVTLHPLINSRAWGSLLFLLEVGSVQ